MKKLMCGLAGLSLVWSAVELAQPAGAQATPSGKADVQRPLSATAAAKLATDFTDHVIVVLRNQPANGLSARVRIDSVAAAQAPILSELRMTRAEKVRSYSLVDALAATVSPGEAARLADNPAVAEVIPDSPVRGPDVATTADSAGSPSASPDHPKTLPIPPGACPAAGQKALLGEELSLIHADSNSSSGPTARSLGFTGAGVKVAYMAEGIDINNPDFIRQDGSHVFVDYQDFSGDGADAPTSGGEAFLDASAIASQGKVYDVSHFGPIPLAGPCRVAVEGVAPGASLVGLKVFAQNGYSTTSGILQAIDYAVTVDHVDVLNESLGYNPFPTIESQDIVEEFNDAAVEAGTTVTVAAGDAGPKDTLGSPDTDPHIIDVGATTDYRFYAETGIDGYMPPFATKGWLSDNISGLSSGGYLESGPTVDVVAPGDLSFAACTPNLKMYSDCSNFALRPSPVEFSGGTSESSPLTAGTAALVIQAYRQTHEGVSPTPALVKQIIVSTADDLGHPATAQGSGLVDAYRAVMAAQSISDGRQGPAVGSQILMSTGQLHATGEPGTGETLPFTITNSGAGSSTLDLTTRTLGPALDTQYGQVTLSDKGPHFFNNFYDARQNYQTITFTVAPGRARLLTDITYKGNTANSFLGNVDVVLIDPEGNFAADAVPQGVGNAAEANVRYPAPGRWTALISSSTTEGQGTVGTVLFRARTFDFEPLGSVTPSHVTIPAGGHVTVQVHEVIPSVAGDQSAAVVIAGGFGQTSSVAVTLRSLVDLTTGGHFSGVLTGGNGRQPDLGQTAYYQFDVPAVAPDRTLRADVVLSDGQTDPVLAYLVDPQGQTLSEATNAVPSRFERKGVAETPTDGVEVATTDPKPGRWTLILNFAPEVTGNKLAEPYDGSVSIGDAPASSKDLPTSAGTILAIGQPDVVSISVKNTTAFPEDYFVDGRLDQMRTLQLAAQSPTSVTLPVGASVPSPSWLVPSNTDSIALTAEASVPVTFDWGPGIGDPDLGATTAGDTATGSWNRAPITVGVWLAEPSEIGPYGAGPPPTAPASMFATVSTQTFDPTVTSSTGDLWLQSIDPSAKVKILTVAPGQTATISVTIRPTGPVGRIVSGTLYVDELGELPSSVANSENFSPAQSFFQAGTQVAALPYQYQVG